MGNFKKGMSHSSMVDALNASFNEVDFKISNVEGDTNEYITIVYLNITTANTTVTFKNLKGVYRIIWDVGVMDDYTDTSHVGVEDVEKDAESYSHTYKNALVGKNAYVVWLYGLRNIGYQAFQGITTLTKISLSSVVQVIGEAAFQDCTKLSSFSATSGLQAIGAEAFSRCEALSEVILPFGVTAIGGYAFSVCSNLEYINIPYSVTSIGEKAFGACTSLKHCIIPDSVVTVGKELFMNCTALETVRLGKNIREIGYRMFNGATLSILFIEAITPPTIDVESYTLSIPSTAKIIVSYGFGDNYKNDSYWAQYSGQIYSEVLYEGTDGYIYQKE